MLQEACVGNNESIQCPHCDKVFSNAIPDGYKIKVGDPIIIPIACQKCGATVFYRVRCNLEILAYAEYPADI